MYNLTIRYLWIYFLFYFALSIVYRDSSNRRCKQKPDVNRLHLYRCIQITAIQYVEYCPFYICQYSYPCLLHYGSWPETVAVHRQLKVFLSLSRVTIMSDQIILSIEIDACIGLISWLVVEIFYNVISMIA